MGKNFIVNCLTLFSKFIYNITNLGSVPIENCVGNQAQCSRFMAHPTKAYFVS